LPAGFSSQGHEGQRHPSTVLLLSRLALTRLLPALLAALARLLLLLARLLLSALLAALLLAALALLVLLALIHSFVHDVLQGVSPLNSNAPTTGDVPRQGQQK
jgi:hypothetical protein